MNGNFEASLRHVLGHEGGWADHPEDPGGATMKGVTLATFRRFFGAARTKAELRAIGDGALAAIYRAGYWNPMRCDELPAGVDLAAFDAAVNSGPARAARWLRRAAGAAPGGRVDDASLAAVAARGAAPTIEAMQSARTEFLRGLSTFATFGRGWSRRVAEVRAAALELAEAAARREPEPLRRGARGEAVARLQTALGVEADGDFGPRTEAALRSFQAANRLEADGVAGRNTRAALGLSG